MTVISDLVDKAATIVSSGTPSGGVLPTGGLWEWAALSGAAVAVSGVILAFMYTWSVLFRNQPLEAYVRQELYELVVSAVLVIFIIGLVGAMNGLTLEGFLPKALIPDGVDASTTVYSATAQYYARVTSDMEGWLDLNYLMNILVDQMASVTPYARPLGVGLVASPMAGFASPIKQLLYNMTVGLSVAYIINVAQLYVYVFALDAFLGYYMPLGIFLRCFTPTRRLGGTLIGVGVAFLFVFPALSTISYSMLYNKAGGPLLTFSDLLNYYVSDYTSDPTSNKPDFQTFISNFFHSRFTTTSSGDVTLTDLVTGPFGMIGGMLEGVLGSVSLTLLMFPISIVSLAFIVGFVVPAFNVIVFTEAAKGMSKSFGEEVDIGSLTRLI